jgi:hypothetical protein
MTIMIAVAAKDCYIKIFCYSTSSGESVMKPEVQYQYLSWLGLLLAPAELLAFFQSIRLDL